MLFKKFIKTGENINNHLHLKSSLVKLAIGASIAIGMVACSNVEEDSLLPEVTKNAQEQAEDFALKLQYAQSIKPNEVIQIISHINSNIHQASSEKELKNLVDDKTTVLLTYEKIAKMNENESTNKEQINEKDLNILLAWKLSTMQKLYLESNNENDFNNKKTKLMKI